MKHNENNDLMQFFEFLLKSYYRLLLSKKIQEASETRLRIEVLSNKIMKAGNTYILYGDYDDAANIYKQALNAANEVKQYRLSSDFSIALAIVYTRMGKFEFAARCYEEARVMIDKSLIENKFIYSENDLLFLERKVLNKEIYRRPSLKTNVDSAEPLKREFRFEYLQGEHELRNEQKSKTLISSKHRLNFVVLIITLVLFCIAISIIVFTKNPIALLSLQFPIVVFYIIRYGFASIEERTL